MLLGMAVLWAAAATGVSWASRVEEAAPRMTGKCIFVKKAFIYLPTYSSVLVWSEQHSYLTSSCFTLVPLNPHISSGSLPLWVFASRSTSNAPRGKSGTGWWRAFAYCCSERKGGRGRGHLRMEERWNSRN